MKTIEIVLIDHMTNNNVARKVSERLRKLTTKKIVYVNPSASLLFQCLRLINTYTTIPIVKQAAFFLDVAKEIQIREEVIDKLPIDDDTIVIRSGSFLMNMFYYWMLTDKQTRKLTTKHIIKKFANPATLLIYTKMKFEVFRGKRRKFNARYRVADSVRGAGLHWRDVKYRRIMEILTKKYGTKCSIIESEDENLEAVIDEIIDVIKESNILTDNNGIPKEQDSLPVRLDNGAGG